MDERFEREALVIGEAALTTLQNARVALFGIGGVGSYVAEALARSGVGYVELIDHDVVSRSNINRQLCALESTVGQKKVSVMAARMRDINPAMTVVEREEFFLPENADHFDFASYDYVVDAIDTVSGKIALVQKCKEVATPILCCMGTGNKLDPTAFRVADISKTSMCPLARVMRRELKKRGIHHLKVVYSEEKPETANNTRTAERGVPGSIAFVPSVAGLIAAGEVIKSLILRGDQKEEADE